MTLKATAAPKAQERGNANADARTRRWRPQWFTIAIVVLVCGGVLLMLYPSTAAWVSQYNQSEIVARYPREVEKAKPTASEQIALARRYNKTLVFSAAVAANNRLPSATSGAGEGAGEDAGADADLSYSNLLSVDSSGLMGRIKIPSIDVDLPIYHGTSDETLKNGIGHLEGTSLPVGGSGTRSVLTGHRGLASSTLFTHLNKVKDDDTFTLTILDEVLTYKVVEVQVVESDETEALRPVEGRDLVTLVTCTPLGINSQRILVTGERVSPTPQADIDSAGDPPDIPGFPWWAVAASAVVLIGGAVIWRSGYSCT
ncbi:MAG: class C sortase [Bifidobacteriaceae bacterium]|jgi:sortase A|nr:class C sortase [Bifidobacteriaceae bacterium]